MVCLERWKKNCEPSKHTQNARETNYSVYFSFRKSELCVHTTHINKRFEAQAHSIDVRNAHESIHDMHILFSFQLWKYNKREPNTSENNKKPKN